MTKLGMPRPAVGSLHPRGHGPLGHDERPLLPPSTRPIEIADAYVFCGCFRAAGKSTLFKISR